MKAILIPVFLFIVYNACASFDFTLNIFQAKQNILSLQFKNAEDIIRKEEREHPENYYCIYLRSYKEFIDALISQDSVEQAYFLLISEKGISKIHDESKNIVVRNACIAQLYYMRALVFHQLQHPINAGYNLLQALSLSSFNDEELQSSSESLKVSAYYNFIMGSCPDRYKRILDIMGYQGSINSGFKNIEGAHKIDFSTEDNLEMLFIKTIALQYFSENSGQALQYLKKQTSLLKNPLLRLLYCMLLNREGNANEIIRIIEKYGVNGNDAGKLQYFNYLLGISYLQKLDKKCVSPLEEFIKDFKGTNYKTAATQKLFWYYYLTGNIQKAQYYRQAILEASNNQNEPDDEAVNELMLDPEPEVTLLKARLLFDGGDYLAAEMVLQKADTLKFIKPKSKLEYIYRLGRINQKLGNTENAIRFFKEVISKRGDSQSYFPSYSAIQIAQIAESKRDRLLALQYYNQALVLNKGDYQFSIERIAKAGISRNRK